MRLAPTAKSPPPTRPRNRKSRIAFIMNHMARSLPSPPVLRGRGVGGEGESLHDVHYSTCAARRQFRPTRAALFVKPHVPWKVVPIMSHADQNRGRSLPRAIPVLDAIPAG